MEVLMRNTVYFNRSSRCRCSEKKLWKMNFFLNIFKGFFDLSWSWQIEKRIIYKINFFHSNSWWLLLNLHETSFSLELLRAKAELTQPWLLPHDWSGKIWLDRKVIKLIKSLSFVICASLSNSYNKLFRLSHME